MPARAEQRKVDGAKAYVKVGYYGFDDVVGLRSTGADVRCVDVLTPPFDEVFIRLVSNTDQNV